MAPTTGLMTPEEIREECAANAVQLAELQARTDHNGRLRPATTAPAADEPEPMRPGPGGGGPVGTPSVPGDIDSQIVEAQRAGDWGQVNRLNAAKLGRVAEEMKGKVL